MPCEVVPLRVDFFKMAAVAMEMDTMDFIIILIFSLFQLKICENGQIRALI
jgi:hypothetical protein